MAIVRRKGICNIWTREREQGWAECEEIYRWERWSELEFGGVPANGFCFHHEEKTS